MTTNGHCHNEISEVTRRNFLTTPSGHEEFLEKVHAKLMTKIVCSAQDTSLPVVRYQDPEKLEKLIDLRFATDGESEEAVLQIIDKTIDYSVRTMHPRFVNQLYSGLDAFGLAGQWVTETLNPSLYTYEVSPVFTLIENHLVKEMGRMVGWEDADGIFCAGGSMSNMYGLSIARHRARPETKTKGMIGTRMVAFCSDRCHYSNVKAACMMGLGSDNLIEIPSDEAGRMIAAELEKAIAAVVADPSCEPFVVVATLGTTVLGAIDPVMEIAEICEKYSLWLHVDAAWGGGLLFTEVGRQMLRGIERSDSVTWNPHKLLGAPQQCSAFLTRHRGILQQAHCAKASYLFQEDKFYGCEIDQGDKSIQCGRKVDVFKFWLMWKAKGTMGLQLHVERLLHLTHLLCDTVRSRPGFRLVFDKPQTTNVCFWYIPECIRGQEETQAWKEKLDRVAPRIKELMVRQGTMLITYTRDTGSVNFFRFVLQNSSCTEEDMIFIVDEIQRLGSTELKLETK